MSSKRLSLGSCPGRFRARIAGSLSRTPSPSVVCSLILSGSRKTKNLPKPKGFVRFLYGDPGEIASGTPCPCPSGSLRSRKSSLLLLFSNSLTFRWVFLLRSPRITKTKNPPPPSGECGFLYGDPGEIRTPDQLVRSQLLYPTELRSHQATFYTNFAY